ncbi:MAG: Nif3-like dinuclear metal center hexameric protein [Bilophila wadsworthia]
MKQSELIALIERTAPLAIAAPWDRPGVQAAPHGRISTASPCALIRRRNPSASRCPGAEMILAHHPLTMEGRFTDRLTATMKSFRWCFRADAAVFGAYVPRCESFGSGFLLADELGLCRIPSSDTKDGEAGHGMPLPLTVLEQTGTMERGGGSYACGFGVVGDCAVDITPEDLKMLALWLVGSCPRLAGALPERIRRIAICPGSVRLRLSRCMWRGLAHYG